MISERNDEEIYGKRQSAVFEENKVYDDCSTEHG